jgi:hypothetical protein
MRRFPILLALFAVSAFAEPAVVSVFEAKVHESPNESSPVIHTFAENTQVSVSEEAEQGWRRVRLPTGASGWIPEKHLKIGTAATSTPPSSDAPRASQPPAPTPKPKIYVKDLPHLAELTKPDAIVFPKATALAARQTGSLVAFGIGGGAGVALVLASVLSETPPLGDPGFRESLETKGTLLGAGIVAFGLGLGIGWLISPKRGDLIDVINEWNTRHPDEQFELDRVPSK